MKTVIKRVCRRTFTNTLLYTVRRHLHNVDSIVISRSLANVSFLAYSFLRLAEIIIKLFGILFSFTFSLSRSLPGFLDKMPILSGLCAKRPQGRLWIRVRLTFFLVANFLPSIFGNHLLFRIYRTNRTTSCWQLLQFEVLSCIEKWGQTWELCSVHFPVVFHHDVFDFCNSKRLSKLPAELFYVCGAVNWFFKFFSKENCQISI